MGCEKFVSTCILEYGVTIWDRGLEGELAVGETAGQQESHPTIEV